MLFTAIISSLLAVSAAVAAQVSSQYTTFSNRVIYVPAENYTDPRVLYARTVELTDGTLLATWENYSPEPPTVYFPIFQSLDHGASWHEISRVHDTVNGWGLRYQPFLYQLPKQVGDFPAGTVVLAGNSIPTDLSRTQIDLYASRDNGFSWEFVSHLAAGGAAHPVNQETPVWEPFILMDGDDVIIYYADQRDPNTGQTTAHQSSKDLRNWTPVVNDAIYTVDATDRPGMPVVALLPNGQYLFAYEYCGDPLGGGCAIHYRMSSNPRNFNSATDHRVVSNTGRVPSSSPFVVWTSWGGSQGTIILSAYQSEIWVNKNLGDPNSWKVYSVPQPSAYTRNLRIFKDRPDLMLMMGAGYLPSSPTNKVSLSVVDLNTIIT